MTSPEAIRAARRDTLVIMAARPKLVKRARNEQFGVARWVAALPSGLASIHVPSIATGINAGRVEALATDILLVLPWCRWHQLSVGW